MILAFYKPFGVLSQFTQEAEGQRTLADFGFPPRVYPVGRLDADSEGLLLLSDERKMTDQLLNPRYGHKRTYCAQVEGIPTFEALDILQRGGINIRGHLTAPCKVTLLKRDPGFPPRNPPIRYRANIPDSWLQLELTEGKNRQVRRMTAAAGFPTLRLLRVAIGKFKVDDLAPGMWREITAAERKLLFLP